MRKKKKYLLLLLLLLLIGVAIYFILCSKSDLPILDTDENAVSWEGNQNLDTPNQHNGQIEIPGFQSLVFKSNQTEQKVNFYNPESNSCLFLMTLYADDTELWQSGYISPGNGYYDITLSDTLAIGNYDGSLLIQCYREDGTTLNSAKVNFDLYVEE